jgi:NAD-dependent dihydropyrimidine dehydrogenase PreA subunit
MWEIVRNISEGKGKPSDLTVLEELAVACKDASMCGLGQTAANPVLSTLRYFRHEFEAHILEKRCPAGVCLKLIRYFVLPDKCTGCLACKRACPNDCIRGTLREVHLIDQSKCIKCGACQEACRFEAIETHRDLAIVVQEETR